MTGEVRRPRRGVSGPQMHHPSASRQHDFTTNESHALHTTRYLRVGEIVTYMALLQAALKDSTVLIAVAVSNAAHDFLSLADALTAKESFAVQVTPTSIQDEFGRFKVCCHL
jgi:hypothetical protein